MPTELLHLEDADLDDAGIEPGLLAAFRAYLPRALEDRRGAAILAPAEAGGRQLLMVVARRIGAALRDENIHLREAGGDLKARRKKLCYLPAHALMAALGSPPARRALADEAACFIQDLDGAWAAAPPAGRVLGRSDAGPLGPDTPLAPVDVLDLLDLLDTRRAGGRPTFLNAAPAGLPAGVESALRARLPILEAI
jgi:hypothetical protein